MKLFGEFLVEKGHIQEDILVQAIVQQVSLLPSAPEIILQRKLLPHNQLLAILKHQAQWQTDFSMSAQALGLWSPELRSAILKSIAEVRMPLGQILINMGALEAEALPHLLDEYFVENIKSASEGKFSDQSVVISPLLWESLRSWNWAGLESQIHGALADLLMNMDSSEPRFRLRELLAEAAGLAQLANLEILVDLCVEVQRHLGKDQLSWRELQQAGDFTDLLSRAVVFFTDGLGEIVKAPNPNALVFKADQARQVAEILVNLRFPQIESKPKRDVA